jgi:hypothetical protein
MGNPLETPPLSDHIPTELEIGLLAIQGPLVAPSQDHPSSQNDCPPSQKEVYEPPQISPSKLGHNSFYAPDEDSDEEVDEGASRTTWKPFIPQPGPSSMGVVKEFPRPGDALAEPDNPMSGGLSSILDFGIRAKRVAVEALLEGNPWVVNESVQDRYDLEDDVDAYFSEEEEEEEEEEDFSGMSEFEDSSEYEIDAQTGGRNVETTFVNGGETQIPETQVMDQTIVAETFAADTLAVCIPFG